MTLQTTGHRAEERYLSRRYSEEVLACGRAIDPAVRRIHAELAFRYALRLRRF